jgi:hypothetical protein
MYSDRLFVSFQMSEKSRGAYNCWHERPWLEQVLYSLTIHDVCVLLVYEFPSKSYIFKLKLRIFTLMALACFSILLQAKVRDVFFADQTAWAGAIAFVPE